MPLPSDVFEPGPVQLPFRRLIAFGLIPRIATLAVLFALELTAISIWLDNDSLAHRGLFLGVLYKWGAWIIRGVIAYAVIFAAAAWLRSKSALTQLSAQLASIPVSKTLLVGHFCAMAVFLVLSHFLYGSASSGWDATLVALFWFITGVTAILLATFAFVPPLWFFRAVTHTGRLWLYTLVVVVLACFLGNAVRSLWQSTNQITFVLVELLLRPFVSNVVANPVTKHIGTTSFAVDIAPECSGFEGVGLIVGFSLLWLAVFRRELRFPHAFLLVPAGVVSIFLLNAVRIAALILIGNAGASGIALGGFHSQAGWISFNAVALAFCVAAGKSSWLNVKTQEPASAPATTNPSLPYLLPFVSIVL
ncbi:MAG: archaeosortase/exosortase family protein, partial [Acidobacteriaceae bacterium]|nr:archaeosortase/exosortase family protein [Acidobacteriaceae bacterium]